MEPRNPADSNPVPPRSWDALGGQVLTMLLRQINPQTQQGLQESGLMAVSSHWFFLIPFPLAAPEPIAQQTLFDAYPYTNPRRIRESLQILAAQGYLKPAGLQYVATDKGSTAIERITQAQREGFRRMDELMQGFAPEDAQRLAHLLRRLVDAVRAAAAPPRPTFDLMQGRPITGDMPVFEVITRMLSLMGRYRSDMHAASWQLGWQLSTQQDESDKDILKGVDGIQWDTLTHIWRGEARTAEAIASALPFRGYRKSDYAAAIKKLVKRGWVVDAAGGFQMTPDADALRTRAEARTDALFYRVWDALDADESTLLDTLLTHAQVER